MVLAVDLSGTDIALTVSLGLFGAVLTALAIVFSLAFQVGSWPSFHDVALIGLRAWEWFLAALAGVVLGVMGRALDSSVLTWLSLLVAALGTALGTLLMVRVMQAAGGRHRDRLLGRLLSRHFNRRSVPTEIGFLRAVEEAIDRASIPDLRDRIAELQEARNGLKPAGREPLLGMQLEVLQMLTRHVLRGDLPTEVTEVLIPQLAADYIDEAGEALGQRTAAEQRRAAAYLGLITYFLAWATTTAQRLAALDPVERVPTYRTLVRTAKRLRRELIDMVDPDPPGVFIPIESRWHHGLTDPAAFAIWMWAFCDYNGFTDGAPVYALAEVFTGRKFFGSYWQGDCVLSFVDDELQVGPQGESQTFVKSMGGLEHLSMELFATSLAGYPSQTERTPPGFPGPPQHDPHLLSAHARIFAGYRPPHPNRLEWAFSTLADLLASSTVGAPLWRLVRQTYEPTEELLALPLLPPNERPAAACLAVALKLAPLSANTTAGDLERFLRALPIPMLEATERMTRRVLPDKGAFRSQTTGTSPTTSIIERTRCLLDVPW